MTALLFLAVTAAADPWRSTTLPPAAPAPDCGTALALAMRDLQAQVTGPLTEPDYQEIRSIFAALCDAGARGPVHQIDETGRRISTRPLSESQRARRPRPGRVELDPVLLLDLESVLDRPLSDPAPVP